MTVSSKEEKEENDQTGSSILRAKNAGCQAPIQKGKGEIEDYTDGEGDKYPVGSCNGADKAIVGGYGKKSKRKVNETAATIVRILESASVSEIIVRYFVYLDLLRVDILIPNVQVLLMMEKGISGGLTFCLSCESNLRTTVDMLLNARPFGLVDLVVPCLNSRPPLMDTPLLQNGG